MTISIKTAADGLTGSVNWNGTPIVTVNGTGVTVPNATASGHAVNKGQLVSNNIVGTTINDNATAGNIGEYASATASGVLITSGVAKSVITSFTLTAGDWDVSGVCRYDCAATTVVSNYAAGISTTVDSPGAIGTNYNYTVIPPTTIGATAVTQSTPVVRISVASTTTVYLTAFVSYSTSTLTSGGAIRARRVR